MDTNKHDALDGGFVSFLESGFAELFEQYLASPRQYEIGWKAEHRKELSLLGLHSADELDRAIEGKWRDHLQGLTAFIARRTARAKIDETRRASPKIERRFKATAQLFERIAHDSLREWLGADPRRSAIFPECDIRRNIGGDWWVECAGYYPLVVIELLENLTANEIGLRFWPMTWDTAEKNALISDCCAAVIGDLDRRIGPDVTPTVMKPQPILEQEKHVMPLQLATAENPELIEREQAILARIPKDLIYKVTVQQALVAAGRGFTFLDPPHYTFPEGGIGETRWIDIYRDGENRGRFTFTPTTRGTRCSLNWLRGSDEERITLLGLFDSSVKEMELEVRQPDWAAATHVPSGAQEVPSTAASVALSDSVSAISLDTEGDVNIEGDVVGRDKITHIHYHGLPEPATKSPAEAERSRQLRLTVHLAAFARTGAVCYFINATNLSDREIELTHVWLACNPEIYIRQPDRLLPRRLKPDESWETWIEAALVPASSDEVYTLARARLSTGDVFHSLPNDDVPGQGYVPGGPIGGRTDAASGLK